MGASIQGRLTWILLLVIAAVWLVVAFFSYRDARREVEALFDAQLAQSARVMMALSQHELAELRESGIPGAHIHFIPKELDGHRYEHKVSYQIWLLPTEKLVVHSDTAPLDPLSDLDVGFSSRTIDGDHWRVYTLTDYDSGFKVHLGEHYAVREAIAGQIARRILFPMALALPLLALLLRYGIRRALSPLLRLADTIGRREPDRLDPIAGHRTPAEARPLVDALNLLLRRVESALEHERRFTADAAHELRTPLAALKTQAQVALKAGEEANRQETLRQVIRGVDRASHLVDQLLTLARLDPTGCAVERERVALGPLAAEVIADLVPAALEKGIELSLAEPAAGEVWGNRHMLMILVRNVVDNAVRYTPRDGTVEVRLGAEADGTHLTVSDSGPGIPEAQRRRVFERFYRQDSGTSSGCGLGLSIVERIAEIHDARVTLDASALGGLQVSVIFPSVEEQ